MVAADRPYPRPSSPPLRFSASIARRHPCSPRRASSASTSACDALSLRLAEAFLGPNRKWPRKPLTPAQKSATPGSAVAARGVVRSSSVGVTQHRQRVLPRAGTGYVLQSARSRVPDQLVLKPAAEMRPSRIQAVPRPLNAGLIRPVRGGKVGRECVVYGCQEPARRDAVLAAPRVYGASKAECAPVAGCLQRVPYAQNAKSRPKVGKKTLTMSVVLHPAGRLASRPGLSAAAAPVKGRAARAATRHRRLAVRARAPPARLPA